MPGEDIQPINPLQTGIDTRPPALQTWQDNKDFTLHFVFMQAWNPLEKQFLLMYLCSACSWYMCDPWSWGTGDTAHSGSWDSLNVCLYWASFSRDKEEDGSPPKDATLLVQRSPEFSLPSHPLTFEPSADIRTQNLTQSPVGNAWVFKKLRIWNQHLLSLFDNIRKHLGNCSCLQLKASNLLNKCGSN